MGQQPRRKRINRIVERIVGKQNPPEVFVPITGREPSLSEASPSLSGNEVQLGGDKALQHLVGLLGDDDPSRREQASKRLAQLGYRDAFEELARLIDDPDQNARQRAARALGKLGDRRAVPHLLQHIERSLEYSWEYVEVRKACIRALGEIADPETIPQLRDLALNPPRGTGAYTLRCTAVEALKAMGDEGFYHYLVQRLSIDVLMADTSDQQQQLEQTSIVIVLGLLGDRRAVPLLIDILNGLENENGLYADSAAQLIALALGEIGDQQATEPLLRHLTPRRTYCVSQALGKLGDPRAVEPLLETAKWQMGGRNRVDVPLIETLGKLGDLRAVEVIVSDLQSGGWYRHARESAFALANIGGRQAITALIEGLAVTDPLARKDVVMALGQLYEQDDRIPPAIINALADRNQEVRRNAAKVLGNHREGYATDALIALLDDRPMVRSAAANALNKLGISQSMIDARRRQIP